MNADAVVKRRREDDQLLARAAAKRRRQKPQLIDKFIECPVFLYGFQTAVKQLQTVFPSRYGRFPQTYASNAMRSRVCSENRLLLISGGRLCAMLVRRLLCLNGECVIRDAFRLGTSALSRRHFFKKSSQFTLQLQKKIIFFGICHPA
jgi:hypothetical protein